MLPGLDLYLQWKINVNDHPCSLQVTNIMATINDSLHHLDLAEEAVVSAPNIEDMLIHMSLMATMAEGVKGSLGMALVGSVRRSSSVRFFAPKTGNHGPQPVQDQPRY